MENELIETVAEEIMTPVAEEVVENVTEVVADQMAETLVDTVAPVSKHSRLKKVGITAGLMAGGILAWEGLKLSYRKLKEHLIEQKKANEKNQEETDETLPEPDLEEIERDMEELGLVDSEEK